MHAPDRQFTPFERLLRRLYELSLSALPQDIRRRWAADMRVMFGERLRDATDTGGTPATVWVGGRELGSIALAAMQSRFGQATGRVHRAHDAQDGSDVWRTDPVPALFIEQSEDRRPLKLATVGALACHFALFLVVFPGTGTPDALIAPPTYVLPTKWVPPPPRDNLLPPDARVDDAPPWPIPDPTPFDPEPIFVERAAVEYAFTDNQPVSADFTVGLPVAPPTPPQVRLRAGADVEPPRLLQRVQPEYPEIAVRARKECVVVLEALIGKTGEVLDIKLLRACGLGLDEAALEAVYQWRYTPTLLNGRPVEVIANVTVVFELK
jgi:TonB family protein